MKKIALVIPFLFACKGKPSPSPAEVMVTTQVPKAVCRPATDAVVCDLPDKSTILSIKHSDLPWRAVPLVEAPKAEGSAAPAPAPEAPAAPTPPPPPAKK